MEDKQNQKTVVAFIAGLLIGGLVVWIFAASSSDAPDVDENTNATTTVNTTPTNIPRPTPTSTPTTSGSSATNQNGSGSLQVSNQPAGSKVTLGTVSYVGTDGWIVVHDVTDGALGWALGASRYSTGAGLKPTTVDLLRNTVKGKTYRVVFHSENGDKKYDSKTDTPIMNGGKMVSADFVAQ